MESHQELDRKGWKGEEGVIMRFNVTSVKVIWLTNSLGSYDHVKFVASYLNPCAYALLKKYVMT